MFSIQKKVSVVKFYGVKGSQSMGFILRKEAGEVRNITITELSYWVVGTSKTCSPRAYLHWVKNKTDSKMTQVLTCETENTQGRMTLAAMPWRDDNTGMST